MEEQAAMAIREIPIKEIATPFQFRSPKSEALSEESILQLAEEMKANGVWDLAIPARARNGKYEIACGVRRLLAYKKLRLKTVRLDVKDRTDEEMKRIAAAENTARKPFTEEEERAIVREFDTCPTAELSVILGVTERHVGRIREAIRAIDETRARRHEKAKSGAVAEAKSLGQAAQKKVIEGGLSRTKVKEAKDALSSVKKDRGSVVHHKVKEALELGTVDPDAHAIEKYGRKVAAEEKKKGKKRKQRAEKKKKTPPGLEQWAQRWTNEFDGYTYQLGEVLRDKANLDHLAEFPSISSGFVKSIGRLRKALEKVEAQLSARSLS